MLRCRYVDRFCTKPPPGEAVVIELDEMWHYLQRKETKVWIWKAYDPDASSTGSAVPATNGPSGGCSSASPAGKCACSAPTVMSSTHWWRVLSKQRQGEFCRCSIDVVGGKLVASTMSSAFDTTQGESGQTNDATGR